ncbi:MAG TPA: molybdopterin converting factor subunit 1 [Ktedonosporobacter sp.]|nr:molybdopterin converting factor subunit 1 [Ktedonosporobacter sp.]
MKIRIRYFASLREIVGLSEETIDVPAEATVTEVRTHLLALYPGLQQIIDRSIYAVNRGYVPATTVLHEDDELVFIPPMGGGGPLEELIWNH